MKDFKEEEIKKRQQSYVYKSVFYSKEKPDKGIHNVVLRSESGKGIVRKKFFDPTDEKVVKDWKDNVLTWNKRIKINN